MNERDTHFQGFAKLVIDKLERNRLIPGALPAVKEDMVKIIAQCAYDLTYNTRLQTAYGMDLLVIRSWIAEVVPDLAKWPEEKSV